MPNGSEHSLDFLFLELLRWPEDEVTLGVVSSDVFEIGDVDGGLAVTKVDDDNQARITLLHPERVGGRYWVMVWPQTTVLFLVGTLTNQNPRLVWKTADKTVRIISGNNQGLGFDQMVPTRLSQVAWVVPSRDETLRKGDPPGMIGTYSGYLKTTVPKSSRQGWARDQGDKFLVNWAIWDPQRLTSQPKLWNKICSMVIVHWKKGVNSIRTPVSNGIFLFFGKTSIKNGKKCKVECSSTCVETLYFALWNGGGGGEYSIDIFDLHGG